MLGSTASNEQGSASETERLWHNQPVPRWSSFFSNYSDVFSRVSCLLWVCVIFPLLPRLHDGKAHARGKMAKDAISYSLTHSLSRLLQSQEITRAGKIFACLIRFVSFLFDVVPEFLIAHSHTGRHRRHCAWFLES